MVAGYHHFRGTCCCHLQGRSKIVILQVMTLYNLVCSYQYFRGTHCLHLQGSGDLPDCDMVSWSRTGVDKYKAPGRHGAWKFLPGARIFKFSSKNNIYFLNISSSPIEINYFESNPVLINKLDVLWSHFKIRSFILVWFMVFLARICKNYAGSWEKEARPWIIFSFVYPCI
jgi:hypothetical protein